MLHLGALNGCTLHPRAWAAQLLQQQCRAGTPRCRVPSGHRRGEESSRLQVLYFRLLVWLALLRHPQVLLVIECRQRLAAGTSVSNPWHCLSAMLQLPGLQGHSKGGLEDAEPVRRSGLVETFAMAAALTALAVVTYGINFPTRSAVIRLRERSRGQQRLREEVAQQAGQRLETNSRGDQSQKDHHLVADGVTATQREQNPLAHLPLWRPPMGEIRTVGRRDQRINQLEAAAGAVRGWMPLDYRQAPHQWLVVRLPAKRQMQRVAAQVALPNSAEE